VRYSAPVIVNLVTEAAELPATADYAEPARSRIAVGAELEDLDVIPLANDVCVGFASLNCSTALVASVLLSSSSPRLAVELR
jgi:hypothetical protein